VESVPEKGVGVAVSTAGEDDAATGRLLPVLPLIPLGLLGLLGLLVRRQELAGLGVTRLVFGLLVLELPELLGAAPVLDTLVGAAALLAGEAGLLPARLLSRRDVPLLCRLLTRPLPGLVLLVFERSLLSELVLETHR
jgi:hypothetical protein